MSAGADPDPLIKRRVQVNLLYLDFVRDRDVLQLEIMEHILVFIFYGLRIAQYLEDRRDKLVQLLIKWFWFSIFTLVVYNTKVPMS
ncbi:MAG: hypothetical protein R3B55_01870 [Candidatus Paceibacterota bacterium]